MNTIHGNVLRKRNLNELHSVYNQLLAEGLRVFHLLVTLRYIDNKVLRQRNWSYTRTLAATPRVAMFIILI